MEASSSSLYARLFSLQGWGLIDLPLRASNEGLLILHLSTREWANCSSLRASDEHIPIVRVLRARRTVACSLSPFFVLDPPLPPV